MTLLIGFFSAGGIGSFVMAVPVAMVVAVIAAILVGISQKEQRAEARARYGRQWYCSKCGSMFEVNLEQAAADQTGGSTRASSGEQTTRSGVCRAEYAARVLHPVQRAKAETERDASWLRTICKRMDANAQSFDPCRPTALDLGAVSRLASLGFLQHDQVRDVFALTDNGAARAAQLGF